VKSDPEYARLVRQSQRLWWKIYDGPLFRGLGFSEPQIEQALDLLEVGRARVAAEKAAGGQPSKIAHLTEFRAAFGDAATERYIEYGRVRWNQTEDELRSLAGNLYYTNEPFTQEQVKQLREIITAAKGNDEEGRGLPLTARFNWEEILRQAESILSPRQLQGVRAHAAQARIMRLEAEAAKLASNGPQK
jgi:hypothetical protein